MSDSEVPGAAERSPEPGDPRPYDLAEYVDGVGVFLGRLAPAHFPEHAHPEVTVAVNLRGPSCLATWETVTGRWLTRLIREGYPSVIPGGQPHAGEWLREAELLHLYLAPTWHLPSSRGPSATWSRGTGAR